MGGAASLSLRPIESLTVYDRNARKHSAKQIEKLAASIREFGFNAPVLVDGKGVILAGHGRLEAARKLGLKEVPVVPLTHLNDAQRRAYILADNRIADEATWDEDLLAAELAALSADGFDLELTGFDIPEIDDFSNTRPLRPIPPRRTPPSRRQSRSRAWAISGSSARTGSFAAI